MPTTLRRITYCAITLYVLMSCLIQPKALAMTRAEAIKIVVGKLKTAEGKKDLKKAIESILFLSYIDHSKTYEPPKGPLIQPEKSLMLNQDDFSSTQAAHNYHWPLMESAVDQGQIRIESWAEYLTKKWEFTNKKRSLELAINVAFIKFHIPSVLGVPGIPSPGGAIVQLGEAIGQRLKASKLRLTEGESLLTPFTEYVKDAINEHIPGLRSSLLDNMSTTLGTMFNEPIIKISATATVDSFDSGILDETDLSDFFDREDKAVKNLTHSMEETLGRQLTATERKTLVEAMHSIDLVTLNPHISVEGGPVMSLASCALAKHEGCTNLCR